MALVSKSTGSRKLVRFRLRLPSNVGIANLCSRPFQYVEMYLASAAGAETPKTQVIFEQISERWEVAFALSTEQQFQQVSFVNSISTIKGGTHVEAVASQLSDKLCVPPFLSSLNCSLDLADL
jgi:hypothetical protein